MDQQNQNEIQETSEESPFEGLSKEDIEELLQVFLEDGNEQLERLSEILLALERNNYTQTDLQDLYRIFHSFKGSAASFGFKEISQISHQLEEILLPVQEEEAPITESLVSLMLHTLDQFRLMFVHIQEKKSYSTVTQTIYGQITHYKKSTQVNKSEVEKDSQLGRIPKALEKEMALREESIRIKLQKINRLIDLSSEMAVRKNYGQVNIPKIMGIMDKVQHEEERLNLVKEEIDTAGYSENRPYNSVTQLQRQISMLGEIRGGLKGLLNDFSHWFFQLNVLAEELRYEALMTRMFPLSRMMITFRRIVRDISVSLGKKVELVVSGDEIEVDRHIFEEIKDPIIHLLRNSLDHGIESPDEREKQGKSRTGVIRIETSQKGSQIHIDVSDDGSGISVDQVRRAAIERLSGQYSPDKINSMSDDEVIQLLFQPGFTTTEEASEVSGRGVGLDVVQYNIRQLHGNIVVTNIPGKGTTISLNIPVSLSIGNVLLFELGVYTFALNVSSIKKVLMMKLDSKNGSPVTDAINYEDENYPLIKLGDYLKIPPKENLHGIYNIVLLKNNEKPLAIIIDSFLDIQEIVSRPIRLTLEEARYFSGISFLPDGALAFVLAPDTLVADLENLRPEQFDESPVIIELDAVNVDEFQLGMPTPLVLVKAGESEFGIPGHWIMRRYKIPRSPKKSKSSRRNLVLGEKKIPLIYLNECLGIAGDPDPAEATVLVCRIERILFALEVDAVLQRQHGSLTPGIKGSANDDFLIAIINDGRVIKVVHNGYFSPYIESAGKSGKVSGIEKTGISDDYIAHTMESQSENGPEVYLVQLEVGEESLGIAFNEIQEIVPSVTIYHFDSDVSNPWGFVNLRGECIEVFDLRTWLLKNQDIQSLDSLLIVLQKDDTRRGLIVERINSSVEIMQSHSEVELPGDIVQLYPPLYKVEEVTT